MTSFLNCPICQSKSVNEQGIISGYRRSTSYQILSCSNCDVSFSNPTRSDEEIYNHIYSQVSRVPGYSRYARLAFDIKSSLNPIEFLKSKEDCYFGVIEFLQKNIENPADLIVEIGCGQGYLTYALRKSGFNVIGLDLSQEGISIAKKLYGNFYHCMTLDDFIKENQINPKYIICTELIEHLEDPAGFLDSLLNSCDIDGGVVVTTPNKHHLEQSIWNTELPPVHLWWFSMKSMKALAERLDAKIKILSLRDFYKYHPYRPSVSSNADPIRSSIFDENYNLISPIKQRSKIRNFFRKFENLVKSVLYFNFRLGKSKLMGLPERDDDILSQSLCCFFCKKNIKHLE